MAEIQSENTSQKRIERLGAWRGFTCRCSTHTDWAQWCPLRLSGWRAPACTGSLRTASPRPGAAETHRHLKATLLLFPIVSGILRGGKSLSVVSFSHGFHSPPCRFAMGNVFYYSFSSSSFFFPPRGTWTPSGTADPGTDLNVRRSSCLLWLSGWNVSTDQPGSYVAWRLSPHGAPV